MRIKQGVKLLGIRPEIQASFFAIQRLCDEYGIEFWITCGTNGKHKRSSAHYKGLAIDVRSRDLRAVDKDRFAIELQARLQNEFDVIAHRTHFHCEWDRK